MDERTKQLLDRFGGPNVFPLAPSGGELFRYLRRPVENGDGELFRLHVENKVLAHDGQANEANITLIKVHFRISYGCRRSRISAAN